MLTVDSSSEEGKATKKALEGSYLEVPVEEYNAEMNTRNLFRVDKVIRLANPSKEEIAEGITVKDKIKEVFLEANAFASTEKSKIPNLKVEGIAHWVGHGGIHNNAIDEKEDLLYRDGSLDFAFITNNHGEEISKDEIKKLEHEQLKDFKIFIQHFEACNSGAMIS